MKIVIGHLYYDLMNLYGEIGNVMALKNALESQSVDVEIKNISIDNKISFDKFDFIYIGSGMESSKKIVLNHLNKYKDELIDYVNNDKFFMVTGDAISLFDKDDFGYFDYKVINKDKRFVDEVNFKCDLFDKDIYGFLNCHGTIQCNEGIFKNYGFNYKNFYAIQLIGPVLVRNPELLKYITINLIKQKNQDFEFKDFNLDLEDKAYKEFISFKANKKKKNY